MFIDLLFGNTPESEKNDSKPKQQALEKGREAGKRKRQEIESGVRGAASATSDHAIDQPAPEAGEEFSRTEKLTITDYLEAEGVYLTPRIQDYKWRVMAESTREGDEKIAIEKDRLEARLNMLNQEIDPLTMMRYILGNKQNTVEFSVSIFGPQDPNEVASQILGVNAYEKFKNANRFENGEEGKAVKMILIPGAKENFIELLKADHIRLKMLGSRWYHVKNKATFQDMGYIKISD